MEKKRPRTVADQVGRRLVAGDEQEDHRCDQLALAELVALLLGVDEVGEHAVVGVLALLLGELAEVVADDVARRVDLGELVEVRLERRERADDILMCGMRSA